MKKNLHSEICYLFGIFFIALGCVFMTKADFGLSMVVAPAYLVHLKLSAIHPFFTFGVTEYLFQAVLLLGLILAIRRFKISYLFSFVTAVVYGYTLDGLLALMALVPIDTLWFRILCYILGMMICSLGVSLMLHTYVSAEVYELLVKEISEKYHFAVTKVKTAYDLSSCTVGLILSFLFFGFGVFEGVKWGTIVCAFVNGFFIGKICKFMDKHFVIKDLLPLRPLFEKGLDKKANESPSKSKSE